MSKLVYVAGSECTSETGVGKKIKNEMKAFGLKGIETELILVPGQKKWKKAIPFSSSFCWNQVNITDADYIYIRWEPVSAPFIRFLKRCRTNNPHAKILMEIATYPYIGELKRLSNPVTIMRDSFYKRFLARYIERICVFPKHETVFHIPTIELVNCISVHDIPALKRQFYRDDKIINVLSVASIRYYYGYDRFLNGLANYYKKEHEYEVRFHLVGDGPELPSLMKLCEKLGINQYVTFYGYKTGVELDEVYELADIGIDVLGGHRKNVLLFGSLKTREYMCKGLPFITEVNLPEAIDPIKRYILKEPSTEDAVDIEEVVSFFEEIKKEAKADVANKMREFALSYCDIHVAMDPIIEYLKE